MQIVCVCAHVCQGRDCLVFYSYSFCWFLNAVWFYPIMIQLTYCWELANMHI